MKPNYPQSALDVIAERERQIVVENYSDQGDDIYVNDELARAAAWYALPLGVRNGIMLGTRLKIWPWMYSSFKSTTRRRDLVKAGALILAEIDRLDRESKE